MCRCIDIDVYSKGGGKVVCSKIAQKLPNRVQLAPIVGKFLWLFEVRSFEGFHNTRGVQVRATSQMDVFGQLLDDFCMRWVSHQSRTSQALAKHQSSS